MRGGTVNVFSDSLGNTNYDIVATDTTSSPSTDSVTTLPSIDIRNVELTDVNINYNDLSLRINTSIRDLNAKISGTIIHDSISGNIYLSSSDISVEYGEEKSLQVVSVISDLNAKITGTISQESISGRVNMSSSAISFEYGGEKYLQGASVVLDIPVDVIPSHNFIRLKNSTAKLNDLELLLNGTIENDTINQDIITDISYKFTSWPIKVLQALVPSSFQEYFEGIEADGLLTSQGSIKGVLNDSIMPLMDIHLLLEKGTMKYAGFPLPLHNIESDITIYTDLITDDLSFVRINRFEAKTPRSAVNIKGLVNHLFTDIYCDITTNSVLTLDEFNTMIPDSMELKLKGKAAGKVKAAFSLSQLEKMQIEKMKMSGSVTLSGFDVIYDSISIKTDRSKVDFSLPNNKSLSESTKFAFATIYMDNLEAGKPESYWTSLWNSYITLETSDVRDTTRIPDLVCSLTMDSLYAEMDTMSISISKPQGKVLLSPRPDSPDQPRIFLAYKSGLLKTNIGQSSAIINNINLETDILNDNTQKDIFLQWLAKGFVDINKGNINLLGFTYPIEIPSIKMDFEPETFNIREGTLQIDKSDFQLTGSINNVLSYFRGDSILKGNFSFVSNLTDVSQLMALTSGLGSSDTTTVEEAEASDIDSTYTGPYMVPKGMDIVLSTNIKKATMGIDIATNIIGNVQVRDGVLLLDGLTFETPAARMQLTAVYRTPRKNHLYLGLDYHMLDVEIGELLTMIPDIDSLMPMLRSFGGKGEFHIAVETYLDSLYNIKKSTLRGASSIRGNNLVLMDGETFSEIAKKLRFNKKTQNTVDSLSAEFTIFRNEIDIYPFLIVMDKYKAVIAGRHNFDLSFDYHVSVVDCPLPIKLGVDIKGNMDDLSYSLAKCRYAEYYRPSSRHVVENKQLELRKLIRETLTQKVKR